MNDSENYTDVDISDIVEDSEVYVEDGHERQEIDSEINTIQNSEIINSEEQVIPEKRGPVHSTRVETVKSTRLPLARIKNIMKMDPDVNILNAEAAFLVTKATEMFLETIVKETYSYTSQNKRKVISKKDLDVVINKVDCLCFLEGAMDF
ncbi:DNA polymerase epsilon subunit 4-like [Epargyreus clarus]|uniref:DNA polymerase epsilon subunit 4-like n=1 Tax=Epargyreus clarus TaxID=520877 RepID=UPI003C2E364D